jgi:hypothetical protein
VTPEPGSPVARAIASLLERRADAATTLELLDTCRLRVAADSSALENPKAVLEYLDFFIGLVTGAAEECARIAGELDRAPGPAHSAALRQIASSCALEQRRCLLFRDKWINKPLPHERMRPLLNEISVVTRDQLTAFRDLDNIAAGVDEALQAEGTPEEARKGLDRRALLTRLFKR